MGTKLKGKVVRNASSAHQRAVRYLSRLVKPVPVVCELVHLFLEQSPQFSRGGRGAGQDKAVKKPSGYRTLYEREDLQKPASEKARERLIWLPANRELTIAEG